MTSHTSALKAAVDLLSVPSRARPMRTAPLPGGIVALLQIAAGDLEAATAGAVITGRNEETVKEAAVFFIEQIMLAPDSDSYRILGGTPDLAAEELRRNMALLLKWLHPDMANNADERANRSIYATRVTQAWDRLKTAERRAAYDAMRQAEGAAKPSLHHARPHAKAVKSGASRDESRRTAGRDRQPGIWRTLFGARR